MVVHRSSKLLGDIIGELGGLGLTGRLEGALPGRLGEPQYSTCPVSLFKHPAVCALAKSSKASVSFNPPAKERRPEDCCPSERDVQDWSGFTCLANKARAGFPSCLSSFR